MAPSCKHNQNHSQLAHQLPQQVVVVVVPFPAQGHLNQLLHFSRLISSYNIPVHYITTTIHSRQVNFRVHGFKSTNNIQFHEFSTLIFNSPTPKNNPNSSTKGKFPSHLQPSSQISSNLRNPVAKILRALSHKTRRIIIIHDSLMGSVVQDYRDIPNAEAYTFHSVSAFTLFLYVWESLGRPFSIDTDMIKDLPSIEGCFTPEFNKFVQSEHEYSKFNSGKIYNTSRVFEGPFLDLLCKEQINKGKKQWALGPFNPIAISGPNQQRHKSLTWLDKQVAKSVIFVSFGTTTSFSDEQIKEIAIGLEQSQQKFIWVLRDADKDNVFSEDFAEKIELPKGYEERVKERGIVVRDWAPQLEILAHTSTGGFLSHCGWNSCMESISMGVPLAAWPMHSDQPRNTVLITKILKVGLVIKDWARDEEELVVSDKIEKVVRTLMASQEGEEMRKRVQELSFDVKKAMGEGGVTKNEFDSFIAHITRAI